MRNTFKLKKSRAQELLAQELGIKTKLSTDEPSPGIKIYFIRIGIMRIEIRDDWHDRDGLIHMEYSIGGEHVAKLYRPDTLEEDFNAEDKYREQHRKNIISDYLESIAAE